jgi:hypothetical protein
VSLHTGAHLPGVVEERMGEHTRMLDAAREPDAVQVAQWIGSQNGVRWTELTEFIQSRYPGVFETKWWFGGKKFGWSLRFKKSKSFCNLIPERGQFRVLLVFGGEEREKVAAVLPDLGSHVRDDYAKATTFHDGRWVSVVVDSQKVLADVERLLVLKRTPKARKPSAAKGVRKGGAPPDEGRTCRGLPEPSPS